MQFRVLVASALVAVGALAAPAQAAVFTGTWSATANAVDPGLEIRLRSATGAFARSLAVGETAKIGLFRIWTNESWVEADDKVAKPITVAFNFTSPSVFGGVATGSTVGVTRLGGVYAAGRVTWGGPLGFLFGDGGRATLRLSDVVFNKGIGALASGKAHAGVVRAYLTYDAAPVVAPVPAPAALPLLVGGLAALGALAARRRRAGRRA